MALEDPTLSELIRDVQASLRRIEDALTTYVTRIEFDLKINALDKRVTDVETDKRTRWTTLVAPIIVGVVVWLLTSGVITK